MTIQEFHKAMRDLFEIQNPGDYLEECLLPFRIVTIDIIKFDDWLHEQVGNYEAKGMNMEEAITAKYGKIASTWVKLAIAGGG
jgi:hypothetical protein